MLRYLIEQTIVRRGLLTTECDSFFALCRVMDMLVSTRFGLVSGAALQHAVEDHLSKFQLHLLEILAGLYVLCFEGITGS